MEKPIQILRKSTEGIVFDTNYFFKFLDKIGDKNVAVLSITGSKSNGKSLFFNMILKCLETNEKSEQWFVDENESEYEKDAEETNGEQSFGIWLWPKAYTVTVENNSQLDLILLDSCGLSLDQNSFYDSGVVFALCLLMSSMLLINVNTNFSDTEWNFFEYFAHYALSLNKESKTDSLQRLLFLVRDWHQKSYPFGYHDNDTTTGDTHIMKEIINPNNKHSLEVQNTRKRFLSCFKNIGGYLLPHPGKNVTKVDSCEALELFSGDFIEHVEEFLGFITKNLEPKIICGKMITGYTMKNYLTKWKEQLKLHSENFKPKVTNADIDVTTHHACNLYESKILLFLKTNPDIDELKKGHILAEEKSIKYFSDELNEKVQNKRFIKLLENLRETIAQRYEIYQSKNTNRIKLEEKSNSMLRQACDLYEIKIQLCVESNPNEAELKNMHIIAEVESNKFIIEHINQTIQNKSFVKMLESLRETITQRFEFYRSKNIDRIKEIEQKIQTTLADASDLYERKLQSCVETNPNDNDLKNVHKFAAEERIRYVSDELNNEILKERFIKILETIHQTIAERFEHFRNKNLVRIKEEENLIIISCFARSKTQKVKPGEMGYQKSNKIVSLELPCPGYLNEGCDRKDHLWFCVECKVLLEYGFDDNFYCDCGRADVQSFEYKCSSKKHSLKYFQFNDSHLRSLLSYKEINILILGETGVGKSTWINGFVNYITYPSLNEARNHPLLSLIAISFTIIDKNFKLREITCGEDANEVLITGHTATQCPKACVY